MPETILNAPTSTVGPNDHRIAIPSPCISYNDNALHGTLQSATERRSRSDADHAPVEDAERSGPETLHDILTRQDVDSSGYPEDRFKVLLSFVKNGDFSGRIQPPSALRTSCTPTTMKGITETAGRMFVARRLRYSVATRRELRRRRACASLSGWSARRHVPAADAFRYGELHERADHDGPDENRPEVRAGHERGDHIPSPHPGHRDDISGGSSHPGWQTCTALRCGCVNCEEGVAWFGGGGRRPHIWMWGRPSYGRGGTRVCHGAEIPFPGHGLAR
jgi:hypothetical protein